MLNKIKFKDLFGLSLCYLTFLCRLLIPYMIYVFVICAMVFSVFQVLKNKRKLNDFLRNKIGDYSKYYGSFLLICFFFLIGLLLSNTISFYLLKEVLAMIMLLILSLFTYILLDTKESFFVFFNYLKKALYITLIIVSILSPLKFYLELSSIYFDFLRTNTDGYYPVGTALITDYNFFSLMNITGIVFLFFDLAKVVNDKKKSFQIQFLIFLLFNNIFFSSSRRASILLLVINLIWLLLPVINMVLKKKLAFKFPTYYFGFLLVFYFSFFTFLKLDANKKEKVLTILHLDNELFNENMSGIFGRYMTIIDQKPKATDKLVLMNQLLKEQELRKKEEDKIREDKTKTSEKINTNPIRSNSLENKHAKLKVEVTSNNTIQLDSISVNNSILKDKNILNDNNKLSGNRMIRIKYAFTLFSSFTMSQMIFGNGFDYMYDFGNHFFVKTGRPFHYDYPHNPILSSLLYAGLLGFCFSLFYLIMLCYFSIQNFRRLPELGVILLFHFYFIFFSGNSFFGTPEFILLGFIITQYHLLNKRDRLIKMD